MRKSCFRQPVLVVLRHTHGLPELMACFDESVLPLQEVWGSIDSFVIAEDSHGSVGDLQPATGRQIVQCLLQ